MKLYSIYAPIYLIHNAIGGVRLVENLSPITFFVLSFRNMSVRLMTYTNHYCIDNKESTAETEISTFTLLFSLNYVS